MPDTVLPGLCDAHVHSGLVDLRAVRAGGISRVDDLGSAPETLRSVLDDPLAPRLRFAGAFLTAPGGYPSDRAWAPPGSFREVRSAEDARSAVDEQVRLGASFVKVALNADAGPVLDDQALAAIVDAAHTAGLDVVAHTEGERMFRTACEHGVDRLAHTPWTERLDDHELAAAAQRMVWISTLDIHSGHAREVAIANLRGFAEHGGTVRYGTDLGNGPLPLGVNAREIRALQAAGFSPGDVLRAMTDDTAAPCVVPGGLDLRVEHFAGSLATAVVAPTMRTAE
ncbi:amidohydrolase family protein [Saccharopolyspora taberi]|uniref:Amidohydrolase family protein n=1 Tax=Saccharopolyspora taberi TaxID=60895 RepID=A0ABN3V2W2_9PSEU